jgi:hypothetical protein
MKDATQPAIQRAIQLHGPGTTSFATAETIEAYMDLLQGVFQIAAESNMAQQDFQKRKQFPKEPITEYFSDKFALYSAAKPEV